MAALVTFKTKSFVTVTGGTHGNTVISHDLAYDGLVMKSWSIMCYSCLLTIVISISSRMSLIGIRCLGSISWCLVLIVVSCHILRHLKEMNHLWNMNVFDNLIEIFKMVASMIARMYVGR